MITSDRVRLFFVLSVVMMPVFVFAQTTSSTADLQALIQQLQEQIKTLQTQVLQLQGGLSATKTELEEVKAEVLFTKTLARGSRGNDVKELQKFLASKFPDIFSETFITGFYGPKTEAAVKKLQEEEGIETVGVVGPKTLTKLNELIIQGAGSSGVVPPGLLIAPGLEGRIGTSTVSSTMPVIPPLAIPTSTPPVSTTTLPNIATTTTSTIAIVTAEPAPTPAAAPAPTPQPAPTTTTTVTTTTTTTTLTTATATTTTVDTMAPATPTGLTATAISSSQINLSWNASTDNIGIVGYRIYRNGDLFVTGLASSTLSYVNSGISVSPSTTYTYTIAAYDIAGNISAQSSQATATTQSTAPVAPSNATVTVYGSGPYVEWIDNADNETRFEVHIRSGESGTWQIIGQPPPISASGGRGGFSDGSPASGAPYYYKVKTCNEYGCSDFSNTVGPVIPGVLTSSSTSSTSDAQNSLAFVLRSLFEILNALKVLLQ